VLEGVFSRGDRRLGPVLVGAWKRGARYDSWRDRFSFSIWEEALAAEMSDIGAYLGPLNRQAVLPWDHIDTGIKKAFLLAELERAEREERTDSCLASDCRQCEGCDSRLRPKKKHRAAAGEAAPKATSFGKEQAEVQRYEVIYEKSGLARFLSHRDLTNHLQRALRRAGVRVAHSEGFHPKMLVSYGPALPLGMEAKEERFEFKSYFRFQERALLRRLNRSVRMGIRILRVRAVARSEASLGERIQGMVYSLDLRDEAVRSALEKKKTSAGEGTRGDLDFIEKGMTEFLAGHPDSQAVFRLEEMGRRFVLEVPHMSSRGFRPQDIVAEVFGIRNASFRLTRERFIAPGEGKSRPASTHPD
jgi:radical SAM-linked protein